LNNTYR